MVAHSEKAQVFGCRPKVLGSGVAHANQEFRPFAVGGSVTDLSRKGKH